MEICQQLVRCTRRFRSCHDKDSDSDFSDGKQITMIKVLKAIMNELR